MLFAFISTDNYLQNNIMKTIILIAISVFFINITLTAQDPVTHDPEAKKVLDKVSATTKTMKTINIQFSYTVENKQAGLTEKHNGFAFLKGQKYKLILPDNVILSDGKNIWSIMSEAEEVTISKPDADDESVFNPAKMFTIYESGFKYRYLGEDKGEHVIDLYPEHANEKPYSRVRLHVDKAKNQITQIVTSRKDGYVFTIDITDFKSNTELPESLFTFKESAYPNYEIIDMR